MKQKKLVPANHAQIGGYLTKKWQFPDSLIDSITYHHAITKSVPNLGQLVIVHVADNIVNKYRADLAITRGLCSIDRDTKRILFRQVDTVSGWFPDLAAEIESACEFLLHEE